MRIKGGWSTRELAEIAGTTLKTVRHYHRIGLLDEPERSANGYKKYRVSHLIRLMRIRRLVDLGVPLSDIAAMQESDEGAEQMLRALDAELATSIERQQRMREDLAGILQHPHLADLPPGFAEVAGDLPEADRMFLLISSRVFGPTVMNTLRELHEKPRTGAAKDFAAITEESSEETRQQVAERYAAEQDHPQLLKLAEQTMADADSRTTSVVLQGVVELYNPAQIDVLQRMNAILYRR